MALRKIKFYGKLGKLFGKEWELDVNTVSEAIKAIDINTNGKLSKYLGIGEGSKKYYQVCVKNKQNPITKEEIPHNFGKGDIYIIPRLKGSGKFGQLIAGAVLLVISFYTGGFVQMVARQAGIALILGGIAQLLAPNPNAESTEQRRSSLFEGNSNVVFQGGTVGTVYGRALVPPMPISMSMDNTDIRSFDGALSNMGFVGTLSSSIIQYSYKQGTATLIGFSEYTGFESVPPKKYRTLTPAGSWNGMDGGGETYSVYFSGSCAYDINGTYLGSATRTCQYNDDTPTVSTQCNFNPCFGSVAFQPYVTIASATSKTGKWGPGPWCSCYGENRSYWRYYDCENGPYSWTDSSAATETLSDEDTDSDAVNRALNSLSWSAWQSTPISPYQNQRTTGFSFSFRVVKTRTITLPDKYNPGFQYLYSITLERRLSGSSDPWVTAETMEETVTPQSDGTMILPEIQINNVSGYETRIQSISINYL